MYGEVYGDCSATAAGGSSVAVTATAAGITKEDLL
jgi:hypothetical protein